MSDPTKAVFVSYAREDADAARRIAEALRAAGIEAWFDQHELRGGDAWDQKIRRQIRECSLFMPVISANANARHEGYFRREWKLAVERTHDMAASRAFLVPVVIDGTPENQAEVPEEFLRVQWTRLRLEGYGGQARIGSADSLGAFCARARILLDGNGGARVSVSVLSPPAAARAAQPPPDFAGAKSVAVLAFANLSHDPENEYFSDGISEELLNVLAKVPGLRVTARTSSFYFKGRNLPVPEIARQLGVSHIVEGSVRKSGNRVRITAQLIDAIADSHLWSETFDRELKDIFAVQDEIAGLIAQNLQLKLVSDGARAHRVVNPDAYRFCLQGRREAALLSEEGMARAAALYARALQLDPGFADALADLAYLEVMRVTLNLFPSDATSALDRAERAACEALRLAPEIGEPHAVLADIALIKGQLASAEASLQRALALGPDSENLTTVLPFFHFRVGRPDRMAEAAERLARANPLSWALTDLAGGGRLYGGRPAEALAFYERAVQLGSAPVSHAHHALALARLGRQEEAIERARIALDPTGKQGWSDAFIAQSDAHAAWALAEVGAASEADAVVRRLLAGPAHCRFGASMALAGLGRIDEALELLPRYPQRYLGFVLNLVHHNARLRNDPRCEPTLRALGALEAFETMGRVLRGEKP